MNSPSKFQFPLWNILLMMIPLAVACWFENRALRGESIDSLVWWAVGLAIPGVSAGIGAVLGGWKGMWKGFLLGMCGHLVFITAILIIDLVSRFVAMTR